MLLVYSCAVPAPSFCCADLDDQEVLLDATVVGEATHGGDLLLGHIELGVGQVRGLALLADLVDLLVDLSAVEETLLTGAGHSPLDTGRMPCTNASNLWGE